MVEFLGEYECKIDSKGRLRLPSKLLEQFGELRHHPIVVNRGLDGGLVLYPEPVWRKITQERLAGLNHFNKKARMFMRKWYRGATRLQIDSNDRILLPKTLLKWAKIEESVILQGVDNMIEMWNPEEWEAIMADEDGFEFDELSEEVLGSAPVLGDPKEDA